MQRKAQPPDGWKSEELAQRAGVSDSTVRGWESGRPIKPENLDRLEQLFGVEFEGHVPDQDALITVLERQNALMEAQAAAYYALALSIDNAARGVLERVAGFDEALTQLLELAGNTVPATDGDGAPVAGVRRP